MQPLLENKASLRTKKVGMPKRVLALLYEDRIEIFDNSGNLELRALLQQINSAGSRQGIIYFTVEGHYFSLDFTSMARRAGFSAFGALGAAVGALSNPAVKIAQTWVYTMQQNGVRFN